MQTELKPSFEIGTEEFPCIDFDGTAKNIGQIIQWFWDHGDNISANDAALFLERSIFGKSYDETNAAVAWNTRAPQFDETKWQLVPSEPTEEMTTAGTGEYWREWRGEDVHDMRAAYRSILIAAPKHGGKS